MGTYLFVSVPIRRGSFPRLKALFKFLFTIILVIACIRWIIGAGTASSTSTASVIPPGAPAYCGGYGNDVGQGAVIDAEVDRDCPQMHNYRVDLYQERPSDGQPYPWCAVLNENPCVATPDMTQPPINP